MMHRVRPFAPVRMLVRFAAMWLALIGMGMAVPAACGTPDDFRSGVEYARNGRALDWIHAAEAFALGYSGKGVTIGILDSNAYPEHQEFAGKASYPVLRTHTPPQSLDHGIHVAGIAAASRDGKGMHGMAYDANLVSIIATDYDAYESLAPTAIREFMNFADVSVANNSWINGYGAIAETTLNIENVADRIKADTIIAFAETISATDMLSVCAVGNDGNSSPFLPAGGAAIAFGARFADGKIKTPFDFASYNADVSKEELRILSLNTITVGAFNPSAESMAGGDFIAHFSNLADGVADYMLFAPGMHILSAAHGSPDDYMYMSGTSMAAPFVTGVAALVKEAFPFMNGKQLADVLLSTATPMNDGSRPKFLLQWLDVHDGTPARIDIIAPQGTDFTSEASAAAIKLAYDSAYKSIFPTYESYFDAVQAALESGHNSDPADHAVALHLVTATEFARLFGMGTVDALKAVRGPGWLDANRLDTSDRRTYADTDYAMYTVDMQGHDAVWANDIAEVKVELDPKDAKNYPGHEFGPSYLRPGETGGGPSVYDFTGALDGLSVGLRKTGAGTLSLAGRNTYGGPTVIEGGTVSLGIAGQRDGEARLAGDVIIESAGTFTGNGQVGNDAARDVTFQGTLAPGLASQPGSSLTVTGFVQGNGTLLATVFRDGRVNRLRAGGDIVLDGARVRLSGMEGGPMPASAYVIAEAGGRLSGTLANTSATVPQGATMLHDYALAIEPTDAASAKAGAPQALVAKLAGSRVRAEAKALSEGHVAGLALLDAGSDLLAGQGIDAARDAVAPPAAGSGGPVLGAFAALSVGTARHATGSHIDMRSLALVTGLAIGAETPAGRLTVGTFLEIGKGAYDTYNSFPGGASAEGEGDASHAGGGVLGSLDFAKTGPGRPHAEASARAGRVRNAYGSDDVADFRGNAASFESDTPYFGWHAGAGYVTDITETISLDVYGQYLSTRTFGETATLSTGDPVMFEDTVSSRLRLGGRMAYDGQVARPFIGAAWEREFDGRQRGSVNGYALDAPSLAGNTGTVEVGLGVVPSANRPLTVELGAEGSGGSRTGVSGHLQVRLEF